MRMNLSGPRGVWCRPLLPLLLAGLIAAPAGAESLATSASSAGSSASSAGSASLRGSSDSIRGSSDSSSGRPEVAEGTYRVEDVAAKAGSPDLLTLTLAPLDAGPAAARFLLDLPVTAQRDRPLRPGDRVVTHVRPYGYAFARVPEPEPFFLVVADDWQRDLETRVVRP